MGTYTVSSLVHVDSFWGFFITTRVCEFRGILGTCRGRQLVVGLLKCPFILFLTGGVV